VKCIRCVVGGGEGWVGGGAGGAGGRAAPSLLNMFMSTELMLPTRPPPANNACDMVQGGRTAATHDSKTHSQLLSALHHLLLHLAPAPLLIST
jgi:hypothetical protein